MIGRLNLSRCFEKEVPNGFGESIYFVGLGFGEIVTASSTTS